MATLRKLHIRVIDAAIGSKTIGDAGIDNAPSTGNGRSTRPP
jgi:hypothetical protein